MRGVTGLGAGWSCFTLLSLRVRGESREGGNKNGKSVVPAIYQRDSKRTNLRAQLGNNPLEPFPGNLTGNVHP